MSNERSALPKAHYRWPWFLLAGVILGVVLAAVWLAAEVRRVKEQRQYDFTPPASTDASVAPQSVPAR